MRIDKFLKNSRLIKRRTVANEICAQERVKINDKIAKPGSEIKVGDIIEIQFGNSITKVEVISVNDNATKEAAKEMYVLK